jgi:hypothetical protein
MDPKQLLVFTDASLIERDWMPIRRVFVCDLRTVWCMRGFSPGQRKRHNSIVLRAQSQRSAATLRAICNTLHIIIISGRDDACTPNGMPAPPTFDEFEA